MFIGHQAVAFAAKKFSPKTSLRTLFVAVMFLDLLWPVFLLLGIEHVRISPGITVMNPLELYDYPYSHSLAGAILWSLLVGGIYFAIKRNRRSSLVVGIAVFSHWILDLITHRTDMPLWFTTKTYYGLGLWNSVAGTLIVELGLFVAGVTIYTQSTTSVDRSGKYGWWSLVAFLLIMYAVSMISSPPPNVTAIAIGANSGWLLVWWAAWVDKHRTAQDVEPRRHKE